MKSKLKNRLGLAHLGRLTSLALGAALLPLHAPAVAQTAWPDKPITLVVPYSAGGPTDVVARMLAIPMGKSLGQTVVVENTVGAGGTIAPARVARAAPNGYTILIHHMGMATAPALYKKLSFDPLKDFEYIGQVLDVPMTLLSRKDFPANNFQELLTYVKANKDKVSLANAGIGAVSQLCGLLFANQIGVDLTTVPYKGAGPALNDLMGGQVDLLCDQTTQTAPVIKDGTRVKVFGVTTPKRLASMPNIPTLDEQGLKGFDANANGGFLAPAGAPKAIVEKLNAEINAALKLPEVRTKLEAAGLEIQGGTPQAYATLIKSDLAKWGKVVKDAGIAAE
jgi:tripartite-type tricarboxylate transporter receptor subunit TctC